jgi:hypothetical protein
MPISSFWTHVSGHQLDTNVKLHFDDRGTMGKLFDKSATPQNGNTASRKPSPLIQGLGSGLTDGLDAYDLSRQRVNASGRGGASFALPQAATVAPPSTDFLTQARTRFAPPGSAFYGG